MNRLALGVATLASVAGTMVATTGTAHAATEHCDDYRSPDKVELDYETTTLNLPAGTRVCYKAGNQVFTTYVPYGGVLTSMATNRHGDIQAFSYYIVLHSPYPYS